MVGNENFTFSHLQSDGENQPVNGATSASPGSSAETNTLDCYYSSPVKKRLVFDFKDLCDPEDDQQQRRYTVTEYVNPNRNGS